MKLEPIAALAVILLMSGCGGAKKADEAERKQSAAAPSAGSGSGSDGAAQVRLTPGQWEMEAETSFAGQVPAEVARMMKGIKTTVSTCITPEEAANPGSNVFTGKQHGNCSRREFTLSGGNLHAVFACGDPGRPQSTITVDGRYGSDSFDTRSRVEVGGDGQASTVESHMIGRRVGQCTGKAG